MAIRGVRGAITVENDCEQEILVATKRLLTKMIEVNQLATADIANIFFTTTPDLQATFPAKAARELGFTSTPLMCAQEIAVVNSLAKAIRILILVNSEKTQEQMQAVYLERAVNLRPDLN